MAVSWSRLSFSSKLENLVGNVWQQYLGYLVYCPFEWLLSIFVVLLGLMVVGTWLLFSFLRDNWIYSQLHNTLTIFKSAYVQVFLFRYFHRPPHFYALARWKGLFFLVSPDGPLQKFVINDRFFIWFLVILSEYIWAFIVTKCIVHKKYTYNFTKIVSCFPNRRKILFNNLLTFWG